MTMTVIEALRQLAEDIEHLPRDYDTEDSHRIADEKILSAMDYLCGMVGNVEVTRAVSEIQRAYGNLYKEYC